MPGSSKYGDVGRRASPATDPPREFPGAWEARRKPVLFFAFGALLDPMVLKEVVGHDVPAGREAILPGWRLAVQSLPNIPDLTLPGEQESPRQLLERVWGSEFRMWTAVRGTGSIRGRVLDVTPSDLAAIEDWELVHLGWATLVRGRPTWRPDQARPAWLLEVRNQPVDRFDEGLHYDPFLGEGEAFRSKMIRIARRARREFLERTCRRSGPDTGARRTAEG